MTYGAAVTPKFHCLLEERGELVLFVVLDGVVGDKSSVRKLFWLNVPSRQATASVESVGSI